MTAPGESPIMGAIVFPGGSRWVCRDNRQRVIVTWPASGIQVDPGLVNVCDAETGDRLPVDELHVIWNDMRIILAEALMHGWDRPVDLAVVEMRIAADPDAVSHACPECGTRRDYRLEPADGGKSFRPGVPLRKRWTCVAGHVQLEDEP